MKQPKIQITVKQAAQFNKMLNYLKKIGKYQTPQQLQKGAEKSYGLSYEEAIEMAYENIQSEAKFGCKGVKPIAIPQHETPKTTQP